MGTTEVGNLTYVLSHHTHSHKCCEERFDIGTDLLAFHSASRHEWHEICILQINYAYWSLNCLHTCAYTRTHTLTLVSHFCVPAGDPAAVMSFLAATLLIVTLIESRAL